MENRVYKVGQGDTLVGVAVKFDTTVSELMRINRLCNEIICPGDIIVLKKPEIKKEYLINTESELLKYETSIFGQLCADYENLAFYPDASDNLINIKFSSIISTSMIPHPSAVFVGPNYEETTPDSPFIICINYNEVNDQVILMFKAPKDKLQEVTALITKYQQAANDFGRRSISMPNLTTLAAHEKPLLPINITAQNPILTENLINLIRRELPKRYRNNDWKALYQMTVDGCSYNTFFEKTERYEPVLLALKTNTNEIVGAFASRGLKKSKNYYGSGESFVFKFVEGDLIAFHWSKKNEYFITSTKNEIVIGGGGSSAIWIDGELDHAMSEPCETFMSPQLTSVHSFRLYNLEAWSFSEHKFD
ncbi:TLD family protein [Trichomonas vaginalis G3]|uniref:Oxidation resistance protein 1 n=1 Tax=Trichomonas vaginalis (strain ATCC PRA-98 / G3) TaxID=412133 RepID=A2FW04_TRIV3|nr:negative regulation of peptidyl-cysteine S-nitrosylation [Trichomonas vaginalis G3]EAX90913.1 TLD family protein [Trichomonas vaginalis G3]KAI5492165.1 negative regulation of peptidyl-cysteine S-nitrosylation [Trichomonas vaginalis G3]|eukprot:XP_001303843.1 TLD family protein [Trichomonas vaginalis G3]